MKFGFVAFGGRPNAGKSTLLNRLMGRKLAIVSDKPQTTRTRIVGVRNLPDGQVVYTDTPGIHRPLHRMNVRMVDAALESMRQADVFGLVADASASVGRGDRFLVDLLSDVRQPVFLILNKIDVIAKPSLLPLIDRYRSAYGFAEIVPVSALTGDNVDRLERLILDYLPEGQPMYPADFVTDQPERVLIAEIVREKVLANTHGELPYASTVIVDLVEEPDEKGIMRVFCSILVDRESQKPIVVGRAGEMVKRIGTAARRELEEFFGTRVFLDLRVKVRAEWREDDRMLDEIGVPRREM
ncbi:MAG: era [Acidobacteria bacterium]|jgi:GTP-binding protein Era|nr:era [Acidobacteriota bacterium]